MSATPLEEAVERVTAHINGALLVDPKRTRVYLRMDDLRTIINALPDEEMERFWPDEIDMFRALRKSPSRKTIDLARTALAQFEPIHKAISTLYLNRVG